MQLIPTNNRPEVLAALLVFLLSKTAWGVSIGDASIRGFQMLHCQNNKCISASGNIAYFSKFGNLMAAENVEMSLYQKFRFQTKLACRNFAYNLKYSSVTCGSSRQTVTLNLDDMRMRSYLP